MSKGIEEEGTTSQLKKHEENNLELRYTYGKPYNNTWKSKKHV